MRLLWVALFLGGVAHAGEFCGGLDGPGAMRELQRYAAGKGGMVNERCFTQSYGEKLPDAVEAQIRAACAQAVQLPAAKRSSDLDSWCMLEVLASGSARAGDRDLVGELIAKPWAWDRSAPYRALAASGDARARPFVLAEFAKHRETWRKKKLHAGWAKDAWRSHELSVLAALEKVGTAEDVPLVDEIERDEPKDKGVAAAAGRARAAAAARKAP